MAAPLQPCEQREAWNRCGRTVLSAGSGFIVEWTGWMWFFAICAAAAIPSLALLAWLQQRGHFATLATKSDA